MNCSGAGLVFPDGNTIPVGSVTTFSGFRISVPEPIEHSPITAVFINDEWFTLPSSDTSSLHNKILPIPVAGFVDLFHGEQLALFFADGQFLEPGATLILSNRKITLLNDAKTM